MAGAAADQERGRRDGDMSLNWVSQLAARRSNRYRDQIGDQYRTQKGTDSSEISTCASASTFLTATSSMRREAVNEAMP